MPGSLSPRFYISFARLDVVYASGPFGEVGSPRNMIAFWSFAVAAKTLWVTAFGTRDRNVPRCLTLARIRFLIVSRFLVPDS